MTRNKFSLIAVLVPLLVGLALTLGGWFPPLPSARANPGILYAAPTAHPVRVSFDAVLDGRISV